MKRKLVAALSVMAAMSLVTTAWGQHAGHGAHKKGHKGKKEAKAVKSELPMCPVMDKPVDFSLKVMTDEGPVYMCCEPCITVYKQNPAKFADRVAKQRAALAKMKRVQVNCPVTGKPINPDVYTETKDGKVYFCCAGCIGKYKKDPAKYKAKLADSYTYQTTCPVMGGEIDPTVYTDLPGGKRVYFCCPGCIDKLLEKPEKFAEKLARQGVNIDPHAIKQHRKARQAKP